MKSFRRIAIAAVALVLAGAEGVGFAQSTVTRLQMISGDRQIAVSTTIPPQPYVVRAVDANGNPVVAVNLVVRSTGGCSAATLQDEFGFRGFNASGYSPCFGIPFPEYIASTDGNGYSTARGHYGDGPPSAFQVSARTGYPTLPQVSPIFFTVIAVLGAPPGNPSVVVEFFDADIGHYFNTPLQSEIDALEGGMFPGWKRSIGAFIAYATAQDAPPGAVPVCRFFSSTYTSHFYTADPGECDAVVAKWPDVWTLETRTAFYIQVPDKATGACAAGLQPIYRMYSTRNGPNHRYVADSKLRDAMGRADWAAEGYGPDNVMLCTAK